MDVITLMILGFGTYIATRRGLVLELTDCCIMMFAGLVAFRGFRMVGSFIHRVAPGFALSTSESIAFWGLLLVFGLMILTAGLHVDRATREFDRIPPEVRFYGGGCVGFFKCLVIAILLSAALPQSKGLAEAERLALNKASSTQALHAMSSPVGVMVSIIAPDDIADKFRKAVRQ